MEFPKTLAAAKRSEWAIADALLEEIGPRGSITRFSECTTYLADNGIHYSATYLQKLHAAARKFPHGCRHPWLTPEHASMAGTPKVLEQAVAMKKEAIKRERAEGWDVEFTPPTKREIATVRKAETHHKMQVQGKVRPGGKRTTRPTPNPEAARAERNRPVTEVQRTIDYLKVVNHAEKATVEGTKFIEALAGQELKADEANDLAEFVQETIDTWKVALDAVRNPLAKSVERFLQEVTE